MQHQDPVCGMRVDERDAEGSSHYQGQTYYFCSVECQEEFEDHPEQYILHGGQQAAGKL